MNDSDVRRRNHWVNHIARHAHAKPDAVYLRFDGRSITWSQLHQRVNAIAVAMARRGVGAGHRVAIMMTNRPEFLETVFAANALGAIAVPVNFRLAPAEIAHILTDSGTTLLVVEEATGAVAASARAACGHEIGFVSAGVTDGADPYFTEPLGTEPLGTEPLGTEPPVSPDQDEPPAVDVPEDSPALIMYTSGTTGRPKGAVLSHQNLQGQALTLIRAWRLFDDDEVNLCASPLFHIASIGSVAPLVLIGGTTVLLPSGGFSAAATLGLLAAERISSVFLVPAQWQLLCADPSLPGRDLSALKTISWGAAPASTTLLAQMAAAFPGATNVAVFGQTEMSPVTCALDGHDALRKIGSVGRPVTSVSARIVDEDMKDVPPGEVGEIVYRGPQVMLGYWQNPAATAEAFRGGWFHSGDLVRADEEGFLFVVDRKKDMIITGGENVYCAEVENALAAHPAVAELAVIGIPDERWGETPVAVAALHPAATLTIEELRDWGTGRLARYKLPTVLHVVTVLPRNASGKVMKTALREQFAPGLSGYCAGGGPLRDSPYPAGDLRRHGWQRSLPSSCAAWSSGSARTSWRSTGSTWTLRRARLTGCSGRTARARPPPCGCSWGWCGPPQA
jgi:fatty-acyl-CoA synthase